jgi:maleate isomerase
MEPSAAAGTGFRHVGHITPSSNTVLEPLTARLNRAYEARVAHHFTRIPVTRIDLDRVAWQQFDTEGMVAAAKLLADAPLSGIVWNGTSGGWRGIEADRVLQRAVRDETGLPFSTSILAQLDLFRAWRIERYALAVPYVDAVTDRIVETFAGEGYEAVGRANLGISENQAFARVPHATIRDLIRASDHPAAECVIVVCTNLPAAFVVDDMEREIGKPIFDSAVIAFWKALEYAGATDLVSDGWGRLLREPTGP